jgi:O-antigen/teichoic acid export membrane protein
MAPAVVFTGAMYILIQASLGARRTRPNLIVRGLCEPGFLLLAGVAAAAAGPNLHNLAMAHVLASAATLGVALLLVGRVFGPGAAGRIVGARPVRGFARFSLPIGASELLNAVLQRADIVMLTAYCGARIAGIYAAAEFLGRMVANVRYAFDSIAASVFSEAIHLSDHERLQYNLTLMTRWVISVSAPLGALAIALRAVLLGLYGPEFVAGSTAMVVLVVGHLVNASCLSPWVLVVSGRSGRMFAANLFSALLNIGLGVVLIPRFGLVGTAVAVGCSIGVLQLVLGVWVWRLQGVHPFDRRVAKPLFSAAVMLVAALFAPVRHLPAWLAATTVIGLGLAVYAGTMLVLGLPDEERALLAKLRPRPRRP